jgi:predicted Zn-ribbon and HTH transcriptional regulator
MEESIFWYELPIDLLEQKEKLIQSVLSLNHVMKKYDNYDKNLLREILKYNAFCSCGFYINKNKLNTLCGDCLNNQINKKKTQEKRYNKIIKYSMLIFLMFAIVFIITIAITF